MSRKRVFTVKMGGSVVEGGRKFFRYTVMGPEGEVMRGARVGDRDEVRAYAQGFADKLEARAKPAAFRITKRAA